MVSSSSNDHTVGRISLSGGLAGDSSEPRKKQLLALVMQRKWQYPRVNGAREQYPVISAGIKGRVVVAPFVHGGMLPLRSACELLNDKVFTPYTE